MIRISQALLVLGSALATTLVVPACSQGQLAGSTGKSDGNGEAKPDDSANTGKDQSTTAAPGEGTDLPVWVNASYLTCVAEPEKSNTVDIAVLCGLDDADGKAVKPDAVTKVDWLVMDADGAPASDKTEAVDSTARYQHRFYLVGKTLEKRVIGVKFDDKDIGQGKKLAMADAMKKADEETHLFDCLAADGAKANACLSGDSGPLDSVRLFVLDAISNGNLGGIEGADLKCQQAAKAAVLYGHYRALLSSSTQDAVDLVAPGVPIYDSVSNIEIAPNAQALFGASHVAMFRSDKGELVTGGMGVWTGSDASGHKTPYNCDNWLGTTTPFGTAGLSSAADGQWLQATDTYGPYTTCVNAAHIYCVQTQN